jgi:hypothetical protein
MVSDSTRVPQTRGFFRPCSVPTTHIFFMNFFFLIVLVSCTWLSLESMEDEVLAMMGLQKRIVFVEGVPVVVVQRRTGIVRTVERAPSVPRVTQRVVASSPIAVPTQVVQQEVVQQEVVQEPQETQVPSIEVVQEPFVPTTSAPQTQEPIPPPPVPTSPPTPTPQPNYTILIFVGIMGTVLITASLFGYSQFKKRTVRFDTESPLEDVPGLTPVYDVESPCEAKLESMGSMDALIPHESLDSSCLDSPPPPFLSWSRSDPQVENVLDRVSWIQPPCQSFRLSDLQSPLRMASLETLKE